MSGEPQVYPSTPRPDPLQSVQAQRRSLLPYLFLILAGSALLLLVALPLVVGLGGYVYYQMSGRIAPGVRVGATSIGWMTVEDAAVALHNDWNMQRKLVVSDGFQSWRVLPAEIGLELDAIQTAHNAFGVARRQAIWAEFGQMARSWLDGWQVAPVAAVDLQAARAALLVFDEYATQAPRNAQLAWDGNQLVVIPSELGYALNISATLQTLEASPEPVITSGYLRLQLMPLIPEISDVSDSLEQAERLLDTPLALQAYDPVQEEFFHWQVPRQELGSWLVFEPGESGPVVGINEQKLAAYLDGLGKTLDGDRWLDPARHSQQLSEAILQGVPILLTVNHRPTTYTVQPGDTLTSIGWRVGIPYWMILQVNPELAPDALLAGQIINLPSKDVLLPLPVIPQKRIVIGIADQRLWVFQDGKLLSEHVISTGIDRSPTQPGIFQVQTHELEAYASVWDLYMPHFLGIYEAWPGFMNGIHGLPRLSDGRRLWRNILGRPASYGCIIMEMDEAEWLYTWAEPGVVVDIRP